LNKLHTKFSALNVGFNGPSLDFLGSRKPAHDGLKDVGQSQSFVKTVADKDGHAIGFPASREH